MRLSANRVGWSLFIILLAVPNLSRAEYAVPSPPSSIPFSAYRLRPRLVPSDSWYLDDGTDDPSSPVQHVPLETFALLPQYDAMEAEYVQVPGDEGDLIFSIGGFSDTYDGDTQMIQVFDGARNTWLKKEADIHRMPTAFGTTHFGHAIDVPNRLLYVVSGQNGPGCSLATRGVFAWKWPAVCNSIAGCAASEGRVVVLQQLPAGEERFTPSVFLVTQQQSPDQPLSHSLHVVGGMQSPRRLDPSTSHLRLDFTLDAAADAIPQLLSTSVKWASLPPSPPTGIHGTSFQNAGSFYMLAHCKSDFIATQGETMNACNQIFSVDFRESHVPTQGMVKYTLATKVWEVLPLPPVLPLSCQISTHELPGGILLFVGGARSVRIEKRNGLKPKERTREIAARRRVRAALDKRPEAVHVYPGEDPALPYRGIRISTTETQTDTVATLDLKTMVWNSIPFPSLSKNTRHAMVWLDKRNVLRAMRPTEWHKLGTSQPRPQNFQSILLLPLSSNQLPALGSDLTPLETASSEAVFTEEKLKVAQMFLAQSPELAAASSELASAVAAMSAMSKATAQAQAPMELSPKSALFEKCIRESFASCGATDLETIGADDKRTGGSDANQKPEGACANEGDFRRIYPEDKRYDSFRSTWNTAALDFQKTAAIIQVNSEDQVSTAVRCAAAAGLMVCARGGKHDFEGASTCGPGGITIDIRKLRKFEWENATQIATLGAGNTIGSTLVHLDSVRAFLPSGHCASVGLVGVTLAGGQGLFTRKLGMTSDRLVSVRYVDAFGKIKVANSQQNQDMFWLARGGAAAGNAYPGVVTEMAFSTVLSSEFFRVTTEQPWKPFHKEGQSHVWVDQIIVWTMKLDISNTNKKRKQITPEENIENVACLFHTWQMWNVESSSNGLTAEPWIVTGTPEGNVGKKKKARGRKSNRKPRVFLTGVYFGYQSLLKNAEQKRFRKLIKRHCPTLAASGRLEEMKIDRAVKNYLKYAKILAGNPPLTTEEMVGGEHGYDTAPPYNKWKGRSFVAYKRMSLQFFRIVASHFLSPGTPYAEGKIRAYVEFKPLGGAIKQMKADETAFGHRDAKFWLLANHFWTADTLPENIGVICKSSGDLLSKLRDEARQRYKYMYPGYADHSPFATDLEELRAYYGDNANKIVDITEQHDPDHRFRRLADIRNNKAWVCADRSP